MFTVQELGPTSEGGKTLKDRVAWLKGAAAAPDRAAVRNLDAVAAVSAIVEDTGPTYLRHTELWSAADLDTNIRTTIADIYGSTVSARPSCTMVACRKCLPLVC
jgi:hypothetical protein